MSIYAGKMSGNDNLPWKNEWKMTGNDHLCLENDHLPTRKMIIYQKNLSGVRKMLLRSGKISIYVWKMIIYQKHLPGKMTGK